MNVLKKHLFLVICAAVVVVALIALLWPIKFSFNASLEEGMQTRIKKATDIMGLRNSNIEIAGVTGPEGMTGVISQTAIDLRTDAQKYMKEQAESIVSEASTLNMRNRVALKDGQLEIFNKEPVPLLMGKPFHNFLPVGASDQDFPKVRVAAEEAIATWVRQLAGVGPQFDIKVLAIPLETRVAEEVARQVPSTGTGTVPTNTGLVSSEQLKQQVARKAIVDYSKEVRCYVSRKSFFVRYPNEDNFIARPREAAFETFVDSWLQQDVVAALAKVNGDSKAVTSSPIKALNSIMIGRTAAEGANSASNIFQTVNRDVVNVASADASGGLDPARSMTGRVASDKYDTVHFTIVMVLQPKAINAFMDELYRQNNGYTLLNVGLETVDPWEAMTTGYNYGDGSVVRVTLTVEALIFRGWTVPLMPAKIRTQLGVKELAAP